MASRLSALRREAGLTLKELGDAAGLSDSYLSRVENLKTAISVGNLDRLAKALGVETAAFFETIKGAERLHHVRRGGGRVVRFKGRRGVRIRLLAAERHRKLMEPIEVEVLPAGPIPELLSHKGEEFIHVTEGRCVFHHGGSVVLLECGDSLYFDATVPHAVRADGEIRARFISVVTSPDYHFHGNIVRLLEE